MCHFFVVMKFTFSVKMVSTPFFSVLVLNGVIKTARIIISYRTIEFHIQLCISYSYIMILYNNFFKNCFFCLFFLFLQNVRQHYTSRIIIAAYICCEGTTFVFHRSLTSTGKWSLTARACERDMNASDRGIHSAITQLSRVLLKANV